MERQFDKAMTTYNKKMSIFWWTRRINHFRFILRELTSVPVAFTTIEFVFLIRSLSKGYQAYTEFMEIFKSPLMIALNIIAFTGLIFHSITWFNLAPKAMVFKIGKNKVPGTTIAIMNYTGWIFVSIFIAWILLLKIR